MTITPVLRYATGETWGTAYTYQGEKVRANNLMIRYGTGGNVMMKSSFKYKPEMKKSALYLTFDAKIKNKVVCLLDIKIADGIIATSALANAATANPVVGADKFQRIIKDRKVFRNVCQGCGLGIDLAKAFGVCLFSFEKIHKDVKTLWTT